jgi:predicted RNA binding protein YcfA (HicA-like mRNA interferase family)
VVPVYSGRDIDRRLLKTILNEIDMSNEEFMKRI